MMMMMMMMMKRKSVQRENSPLCVFLNFSPKPTKTDASKRRIFEREFKKCERWKALRIFPPKPLFFTRNCQKVTKKRPHRHTRKRETNTTKTTQHQSSCSLLLLTRFDHHHRSSRRMSPNLLDHLLDHRRRWKSARWGWKKVRYCFRFRRLVVIHLISTRRFQKWMCFFLFSSFDEDDETITMNKDRYRSVHAEYDERNDAGRSDRDDRQQQRLSWSSLICFCLSAPFFRITDRD